ncbi:MAG: septation protein A [Alphaproteobacteria bacterium]
MVKQTHRLNAWQRLALDFAPLACFFLGFRLLDLWWATGLLIGATALSLAITYAAERRVSPAPLISGVLVAIFGALTIALKNELFIKIKPTAINLAFGLILLAGVYGYRKGLLRYVLDVALHLSDEGWLVLSRRWGFFFLFLAALNEAVWRTMPTEFWVNFKVFGMFSLTVVFALAQVKLIEKYESKEGQ